MKKYDLVIVGAGLFGSVIANRAIKDKKSVLIVERRNHIGGNCYTENIEGIQVHKYGAHIFRTSDQIIWNYFNQFADFNNFINTPIANYHGTLYNLPFNMNTFIKLWPDVLSPTDARNAIERTRIPNNDPKNLEEHVLNLVGKEIYETLIRGYTEKQWGKPCRELPASIMRRIPIRFTFNNNYFNDFYQGIPIGGYTNIFDQMIQGCDLLLETDYLLDKDYYSNNAYATVFTGQIDAYFDFELGALEYRSLYFDHKILDLENYQGVAVMNYTDNETPFTRSIEHKHFENGTQKKTVVSFEYPMKWQLGEEPYYPLEDKKNTTLYSDYAELAKRIPHVYFGGRLGEYRYYDMQETIMSAIKKYDEWFN